jgi:hypothetical protein
MDQRERRLMWFQAWGTWFAPAIAAAATLAVLFIGIRSDRDAERRAEARRLATDRAALLAQTGSRGECLAVGDTFTGPYPETPVGQMAEASRDFEEALNDLCNAVAEDPEQPPGIEVQRELVAQLIEHPKQREEILALWRAIYDADEWIDRVEAALN